MKAFIEKLGVIDQDGRVHEIKFKSGLNIITGRSSTGKSAIISIFDYCMGKSQNNIPRGVISDNAALYFIIWKMDNGFLVLARRHTPTSKAFIKPEREVPSITEEYFSDNYFIPLKSFIEELGQYMGLEVSDTDESKTYGVKKGRPSVRNMISFMLQPQNLVANNQGLFYRFDDSEHKEKVISEFKIFLRLVDQNYYMIHQQLEEARKKKKEIEWKIANIEDQISISSDELSELRDNYKATTGLALFENKDSRSIVKAPQLYIDKLYTDEIKVDENSENYKLQYESLSAQKNKLLGERRLLEIKRSDIISSIKAIKRYSKQIEQLKPTSEAYDLHHYCPFCNAQTTSTQNAANALRDAINWLNQELQEAPSLWKTYLPQLNDVESKIRNLTSQLQSINNQITKVRKIGEELKKNNSLEQQARLLRIQISYLLNAVKGLDITSHEASLETVIEEIGKLEAELKDKYNLDEKIREIELFIDKTMNAIAQGLSFEDEYKPVKLHFDTKKFELYCIMKNERIYLSSMGSAANWLYSHLCLFLALIKLFCKDSDHCTIPPILFIDQPSQVYFPSITRDDNKDKFNVEDLVGKYGNEDLREVSNIFIRILDFIENVKSEYGIIPQIILTEHADDLELGSYNFEDYIVKRWRNKSDGLIQFMDESLE